MPRKLVAKDHREAYHLWATHCADPGMMANREPRSTRLKLERLTRQLPLESGTRLLDVGPGDGCLFRLIAHRVAHCSGVDPSPAAVRKLTGVFAGVPNVEFTVGCAEALPYEADAFDVVVMNSVLQILPSVAAVETTVGELVRVCRPGGLVFVGELPFRNELAGGLWRLLARRFREYGVRHLVRNLYYIYGRPLLRGEPTVLYPATNLHFSQAEFEAMCLPHGLMVDCRRHLEPSRQSMTRNDYFMVLPSGR